MSAIQQIKYRTILNSHVRFTTEIIIHLVSREVGVGAAPQGETSIGIQRNKKSL